MHLIEFFSLLTSLLTQQPSI